MCVFVQTYIPMGKFCRTSFHRGLTFEDDVDDDDEEDDEVDIPSEKSGSCNGFSRKLATDYPAFVNVGMSMKYVTRMGAVRPMT